MKSHEEEPWEGEDVFGDELLRAHLQVCVASQTTNPSLNGPGDRVVISEKYGLGHGREIGLHMSHCSPLE